jgi:cytochrome c-type biogenesis protein CcmH
MWTFWLPAVLMVLLAAALILFPLRRRRSEATLSRTAVNTSIFRERLAELDIERQEGRVDAEQYRQLRAELERTLLGDVPAEAASTSTLGPGTIKLAGVMAVLVPLLALGYYYVSSYRGEVANWVALQHRLDALAKQAIRDPDVLRSQKDLDLRDFTRVLQAHLAQQGMSDPDGLYLLGISYLELQQAEPARAALERAYELQPERPDIMLAYAQALIFANDGRLDETSTALLHRVLQANPHQQRALFLLGLGSFNNGDYEKAVHAWQSLLALRSDATDSEGARLLKNSIARAQALLAERNQAPAREQPTQTGPRLAVTVDLSPQLREKLSPDATLFIFAKAADGPPMPLAAVRQPVKDFPVQVVLDDSQAVMPAMKLSNFKQVVVNARIAKAGSVTAQSGDLQGTSGTLELKEGLQPVTLVIDQVVP